MHFKENMIQFIKKLWVEDMTISLYVQNVDKTLRSLERIIFAIFLIVSVCGFGNIKHPPIKYLIDKY